MQFGLPEWTVLAVVAEKPVHGFAVAALTAEGGALGRVWRVPRPVVYRALGRLEDAGMVERLAVESGQGPQRTLYGATAAGRAAADTWLATPVEHVRDVRSHLLLKLALLHRRGAPAADLLRRQREALAPIAAAIAAGRREAGRTGDFDDVLLRWRDASTSAVLAFLDALSADQSAETSRPAN